MARGGVAAFPMGGIPEFRDGEGLARDLETELREFFGYEFVGHAVVLGARDAAPVLFAVIETAEGDGGEFADAVFDAVAIDVFVRFLAGLERVVGVFAGGEEELVHVAGKAEAVGFFDFGAGTHLGGGDGREEKQGGEEDGGGGRLHGLIVAQGGRGNCWRFRS